MGLFEDAIEQLHCIDSEGSIGIDALSLMANCKLELGRPVEAARDLEQAIGQVGDSDSCSIALRYDLAEAQLAGGRRDAAIESFTKVASADPQFREVTEKLRLLRGSGA